MLRSFVSLFTLNTSRTPLELVSGTVEVSF